VDSSADSAVSDRVGEVEHGPVEEHARSLVNRGSVYAPGVAREFELLGDIFHESYQAVPFRQI
jgi:hypothetical protein